MSTPLETPISPHSLATGREPGLTAMAAGRPSLAIDDVSDTAAGLDHLVRRDASLRATLTMITITAGNAVLGALHLNLGGRSR